MNNPTPQPEPGFPELPEHDTDGYPVVRHVRINICQACLDGVGQMCHTPGCAFCRHKVDLPIHPGLYEVIPMEAELATPTTAPEDAQENNICPDCKRRMDLVCDATGQHEHYHCFACENRRATPADTELRAIVHQLDRRDALDGFKTVGDKISALLKIAAATDPKAELAKALARAETLERDLATAREELRLSIEYRDSELDKAHQQLATLRAQLDAKEAECRQWKFKHETACQTITEMQLERQHRDSYTVLASISSFLGMGGGDASAKIYEERIRQGIAHVTDVQNERAEKAEAEITRLTTELDAVRKEIEAWRNLTKSLKETIADTEGAMVENAEARDAAQARCGALERLIGDLVTRKVDAGGVLWSSSNIAGLNPALSARLEALLTPSQQPDNLKGGDEPCAPKETKSHVNIIKPKLEESGSKKMKTSASNPQPESPIPSGLGQPSHLEPVKAGECPICGALEVEANHPRTFYACGSSDYDQRPGTFLQSVRCAPPIALEGKATEGEG